MLSIVLIHKTLNLKQRPPGIFYLIVFLLFVGCSHTRPYFSPSLPVPIAQEPKESEISHRFILIGDAGEPEKQRQCSVLANLETRAALLKGRTTILFLGDNIYESGLPEENTKNRSDAEGKIDAQIAAVENSGAKGIFISGNHDWNHYDKGGQEALKRQQDYIQEKLGEDAFEPWNGCPGPIKIDIGNIRLIIIDSQWWLHEHEKPITPCCFSGKEIHSVDEAKKQFLDVVTKLIESTDDQHIIFAAHHPLDTHGPHGGFYDWQDNLFPGTRLVADWLWIPLPGIGSLYPFIRWRYRSEQDLVSSEYKGLVEGLEKAISKAKKPVIFAAGHEHSLQVLKNKDNNNFVVISGSGSPEKVTPVGHDENTIFALAQPGFIELDYLNDGRIYLRVIEKVVKKCGYKITFSYWLLNKSL